VGFPERLIVVFVGRVLTKMDGRGRLWIMVEERVRGDF